MRRRSGFELFLIIGLAMSQPPLPVWAGAIEPSIAYTQKLIDAGSFSAARKMVERMKAQSEDDSRVHLLAARLYRRMGKWSLSIVEYENVLRLEPDLLEPHIALSQMYLENLSAERALLMARNAALIDPTSKEARITLVSALLANYNSQEAREEFERLKRDYPSDPDVLYLASRLYLEAGEVAAARQSLETALRLKPENINWLFELCDICQSAGQYVEARDAMQLYLKAAPDSVPAFLKLAEIEEYGLRELNGARRAYSKALELDPENLTAIAGLERLDRKRTDVAAAVKRAVRQWFSWWWSLFFGSGEDSTSLSVTSERRP